MRNRARCVLLVSALLLALTGCVKVDADLKVSKDETVSGRMLLAIDKSAAQQLGISTDRIRQQIEDSIKTNASTRASCKAYEEGNYVGTDCSLDKVPFDEMSGSDEGDFQFQKQGDRFIVTGGTGSATQPTNQENLPKPDVKFKITMPGKILEHDPGAQVDGNAATYTDPTKMANIRLVSDSSGSGFPMWAIILIAALAALAVGAIVFFVLRGRRGGAQQLVPGQQNPGQYPGRQYPGQYPGQQPYPGQQQGGQWGQPQQGPPQGGQWGQPGQQGPQQGGGQWGQRQQSGYPGQQQGGGQWGQPQQRPPQGGQWGQPQQRPPQGGQWGQPQPGPQQGGYPGQQGPQEGPQQGPQQGPPQQWGGSQQQGPDDSDERR